MRILLTILIIISGSFAVIMQFRNRKEEGLFVDDYIAGTGFFWLTVLCITGLLTYTILKKKWKDIAFTVLPLLIGTTFIIMVIAHRKHRRHIEASESILSAWTDKIGTDGGFILEFKKDGYLTGEKRNRFATTYYWGTYKQDGKYYLLNAPFDFALGKKAYVDGEFMHFEDDTLKFEVQFLP